MITKNVVDHLNRYKLLSDKQYRFDTSTATADTLNAIGLRIDAALGNKIIMTVIALETYLKSVVMEGCFNESATVESLQDFSQLLNPF